MKQNQEEILLPSFIISYISYCSLIWMFYSKISTKKINAVLERPLRIIPNDYETPYPLLLEEAHQVTFDQRCINYLMIEVYKHLNGHSPDIMNDIFKLRKNVYKLQSFHIFQTENPRSLKYVLDSIPYRTSQLWQQVPIDIRLAASLALFKNRIKTWKCEDCPCRSCKIFTQTVGNIWLRSISNWL